jgi:hypothetical protein
MLPIMIAAVPDIETTILSRVIAPQEATLSAEAARAFLSLQFSEEDLQRMRDLAELARQGDLSTEDEAWLRGYERIGSFLGLLQSKARMALRQPADPL